MADGTPSNYVTNAKYYRVINISVTTSLQTLRSLIAAALGVGGELPKGNVVQISLSSSVALSFTDGVTDDTFLKTIAANTEKVIPSPEAMNIKLKGASSGTASVEFLIG